MERSPATPPSRRDISRPDVEAILAGLKDFQRDTVDYVFHRLYLDAEPTQRFLIADEVGLGKTLVARGLIARAIDHLWNRVERIDVVYICSNADIARQNINRLNVTRQTEFTFPSRITLLPVTVRDLKRNPLNFISLTPGTSFDLRSSLGMVDERALLYWLLDHVWAISRTTGPLNVLQGGASKERFRSRVKSIRRETSFDEALADEFGRALEDRVASDRQLGRTDLKSRFVGLCEQFAHARKHVPPGEAKDRRAFVGELRALLAASCLRALQPDLVILDEFQRFKHLLEGKDAAAILAQELFAYADGVSKARVLLLSATPYKMYTLDHEPGEDHYQDFLRTLKFLLADQHETNRLTTLLQEYRRELFRLGEEGGERLPGLKDELEKRLRRIMVRTERLAVTSDRNGMLAEVPAEHMALQTTDLQTYLKLQAVARTLNQPDALEYWKSAPYLLNFMEEYELKRALEKAIVDPERDSKLARQLWEGPSLLLSWEDLRAYREVDPANARLRSLLAETVGSGSWRLLWIPPSLPYYKLGGSFADAHAARFTKRLVFSSWRVVPKVIGTLLSYEAERRMMRSYEQAPENSPEARRRRRGLLRFARAEGRLTGMPILGLLYPSITLARLADPLELVTAEFGGQLPPIQDLVEVVRQRIERLLPQITADARTGPSDEDWYWAAPILMDLHTDLAPAREWLMRSGLARTWSAADETDEERSAWRAHVERAQKLIDGFRPSGAPPADLSLVLAYISLAGPGVAALRAIARVTGRIRQQLASLPLRDAAASVAWSFRNLFNHPEVMALIRGLNPEEPYWRRVLEYCVDGGLQAVLDEYAHVLRELYGLFDVTSEDATKTLSEAIQNAISIRTPTLGVDELPVNPEAGTVRIEMRRMRARFALRFGQERSEDGDELTRADQVREAFNSPFWPFVLATTSVGQEGLDFHAYCHVVVHWNLPSNPVDLEQREGRVHRYKGHAVRKNLASCYGVPAADGKADPWEILFQTAQKERAAGMTDLVPFWVFMVDGGAKIERRVPALPLSRDRERLRALRAALTVYRMVFGQPRQEDLVAYLLSSMPESEIARILHQLRIDLSPPRDKSVGESTG